MENYNVEVEIKKGGTETEDCKLKFTTNGTLFYEMQFHWMGTKDAIKDFNKLPELIRRMNIVIVTGDSTYRMSIDKTQINISGNIIKFWVVNTHYSVLHLKINESLMTAFKHLYNWYYKNIKITEESPDPTMLVEDNTPFSSTYKVVTYAKDKVPEKMHLLYEV